MPPHKRRKLAMIACGTAVSVSGAYLLGGWEVSAVIAAGFPLSGICAANLWARVAYTISENDRPNQSIHHAQTANEQLFILAGALSFFTDRYLAVLKDLVQRDVSIRLLCAKDAPDNRIVAARRAASCLMFFTPELSGSSPVLATLCRGRRWGNRLITVTLHGFTPTPMVEMSNRELGTYQRPQRDRRQEFVG